MGGLRVTDRKTDCQTREPHVFGSFQPEAGLIVSLGRSPVPHTGVAHSSVVYFLIRDLLLIGSTVVDVKSAPRAAKGGGPSIIYREKGGYKKPNDNGG